MSKRIDKETLFETPEEISFHAISVNVADSEALEDLMSWSNKIPENMKIKEKK